MPHPLGVVRGGPTHLEVNGVLGGLQGRGMQGRGYREATPIGCGHGVPRPLGVVVGGPSHLGGQGLGGPMGLWHGGGVVNTGLRPPGCGGACLEIPCPLGVVNVTPPI